MCLYNIRAGFLKFATLSFCVSVCATVAVPVQSTGRVLTPSNCAILYPKSANDEHPASFEDAVCAKLDEIQNTVDAIAGVVFGSDAVHVANVIQNGPPEDVLYMMTSAAGRLAKLTTASNQYALSAVAASVVAVIVIGIAAAILLHQKKIT